MTTRRRLRRKPALHQVVPWATVAFFVVGIALALFYRSTDKQRYEAIGRYVHQDA